MKRADADGASLFACAGISKSRIHNLAVEAGFCRRSSGKIHAFDFLLDFCVQSAEGTVSYNDLAARCHARTGVNASRQAYWERTGEDCVVFFQSVLESVMRSKLPHESAPRPKGRFKRILVQDSTIIRLPARLFKVFSGVKNSNGSVCNARIQGVYDLIAGRFTLFSVDPYSRNDLAAGLDIRAQPGDLIIRDRGYFCLSAIENYRRAGAELITLYKYPTALFDPATGRKIDLLDLLNRNGALDMPVLAGDSEKAPLRLVAIPVNQETANRRRMKAYKEIKGRVPSIEVLRLMSWTIFLTTLTDPDVTPREILALYGMRWRIECIFKTWKSNFNLVAIHNVSERQLRVLVCARLIMITLAYEKLFAPLAARVRQATGRTLSLMKFMRYLSRNLSNLPALLAAPLLADHCLQALLRYCAYDKRHRPNYAAQLESLVTAVPTLLA